MWNHRIKEFTVEKLFNILDLFIIVIKPVIFRADVLTKIQYFSNNLVISIRKLFENYIIKLLLLLLLLLLLILIKRIYS